MKRIYIFLVISYTSSLYTMDCLEEIINSLIPKSPVLVQKKDTPVIPDQVPSIQLVEAIKKDSNRAAELAAVLPEEDLQDLLCKAARLFPLVEEYKGAPSGQETKKYRDRLKKLNNKVITFILFQPWAGPYIEALNELKIWGQHATERTLFRAIKKKDCTNRIAIIEALLDNGTNVNTTVANKKSYTPLEKTMKKEHFDVAALLIDKGADVNLSTPLVTSIQNGHTEAAIFLIKHGAEINLRDKSGTTPLSALLKNEDLQIKSSDELIKLLVAPTTECSNHATKKRSSKKRKKSKKRKCFEIIQVTFENQSMENPPINK